ncbi:hypothetical protein BKA62DRAFT_830960 [Auriculariales sp. MPI-PUGE-AT-0066]|nr:hypothetical protein BKA62DRAFT_830960 [Auriculariales sp. MPI-PUGE-AT-0066]
MTTRDARLGDALLVNGLRGVPVEVWLHVFAATTTHPADLNDLARVCRAWRSAIIYSPRLWSGVDLNPSATASGVSSQMLEQQLQRSCSTTLTVSLVPSCSCRFGRSRLTQPTRVARVLQEAQRIATLSLRACKLCYGPACPTDGLFSVCTWPALVSLTVAGKWDDAPLDFNAPNLRHLDLSLSGLEIVPPTMLTTNLSTLKLGAVSEECAAAVTLICQQLQELTIGSPWESCPWDGTVFDEYERRGILHVSPAWHLRVTWYKITQDALRVFLARFSSLRSLELDVTNLVGPSPSIALPPMPLRVVDVRLGPELQQFDVSGLLDSTIFSQLHRLSIRHGTIPDPNVILSNTLISINLYSISTNLSRLAHSLQRMQQLRQLFLQNLHIIQDRQFDVEPIAITGHLPYLEQLQVTYNHSRTESHEDPNVLSFTTFLTHLPAPGTRLQSLSIGRIEHQHAATLLSTACSRMSMQECTVAIIHGVSNGGASGAASTTLFALRGCDNAGNCTRLSFIIDNPEALSSIFLSIATLSPEIAVNVDIKSIRLFSPQTENLDRVIQVVSGLSHLDGLPVTIADRLVDMDA